MLNKNLFQEPVEIGQVPLNQIWNEDKAEDIKNAIKQFYEFKDIQKKEKDLTFYSVQRTEEGLVHPAYVTPFPYNFKTRRFSKAMNSYAVIRFYEKNQDSNEQYFDRAKYHIKRIKVLKKLRRYYPPTLIYDSSIARGVIVFQKFYFYPICKFNTKNAIKEFFNLIYYASVNGIFLDYNQNHFLWNERKKLLLYTDADFIDELPFNRAVEENFNQATIYLSKSNANWFSSTINAFKDSRKKKGNNFFNILTKLIKEKLLTLGEKKPTKIIIERIEAYELILSQSK